MKTGRSTRRETGGPKLTADVDDADREGHRHPIEIHQLPRPLVEVMQSPRLHVLSKLADAHAANPAFLNDDRPTLRMENISTLKFQ